MPLKTKLKDVHFKNSFIPPPPGRGANNWKEWINKTNKNAAVLKKKKKK